jgi:hypothetical protein
MAPVHDILFGYHIYLIFRLDFTPFHFTYYLQSLLLLAIIQDLQCCNPFPLLLP